MNQLDPFEKKGIAVLVIFLFIIFIFPGQILYEKHLQSSFENKCKDTYASIESEYTDLQQANPSFDFFDKAIQFVSDADLSFSAPFECTTQSSVTVYESDLLRINGFANQVNYWHKLVMNGYPSIPPPVLPYKQFKIESLCYGYSVFGLETPHCVVYLGIPS